MSRIEVKISPTVTPEQRNDPRFIAFKKQCEGIYTDPTRFHEENRDSLTIHEAAHALYAERANATHIKFCGPYMFWDAIRSLPLISYSSVSWKLPDDVSPLAAIKSYLAGVVFREILTAYPNDQDAINFDLKAARSWFERKVNKGDVEFEILLAMARGEIIENLKSAEFKKLVWSKAKEFERAVFPPPEPTSKMFKARRANGLSAREILRGCGGRR